MNTWSFLGEVAVMSPHDGGTHQEWGVEGRGMTVLSQILSDGSLFYSLKHISTGELSLHISWRSTHLLHLHLPFSWWRHGGVGVGGPCNMEGMASIWHTALPWLRSRWAQAPEILHVSHLTTRIQPIYKHICLQGIGCVRQKLLARSNATIVINACNHRQCWKSKWCNHRQGHFFLLPLLHRMGIK